MAPRKNPESVLVNAIGEFARLVDEDRHARERDLVLIALMESRALSGERRGQMIALRQVSDMLYSLTGVRTEPKHLSTHEREARKRIAKAKGGGIVTAEKTRGALNGALSCRS